MERKNAVHNIMNDFDTGLLVDITIVNARNRDFMDT